MDGKKQIPAILCICFISLLFLSPLYAQEEEKKLNAYAIAKIKYDKAKELYKAGEYEKSLELVDLYIREFEDLKVRYPKKIRADIYVLRGMLSYAFREEGYREEIEILFLKAVKIHLSAEIGDSGQVPPFLVELFKKTKGEYLGQYSKTAKRNTIGLVTTLICTEEFRSKNFQPGIHYAFNINNFLSINTSVKLGMGIDIWDAWHFKVGSILYSDYRVEKFVFGIGFYDIVTIKNWTFKRNSLSLTGHGEFITRLGFGLAVDIEVLRLDIINEPTEEDTISPIGNNIQFFFANFDLYLLYTF